MRGYLNRIIIYCFAGVLMTILLYLIHSGVLVEQEGQLEDTVQVLEKPINLASEETRIEGQKTALVLYSEGDEYSEKLRNNLQKVCDWMKIKVVSLDAKRSDTVSFMGYDMVVIATIYTEEELGKEVARILNYVETGGKLLWAALPSTLDSGFRSVYRKLGIIDYGEYTEFQEYAFIRELMPGCQGLSFSGEEFLDTAVAMSLEAGCKVYVESIEKHIPLIWSFGFGKGRSIFCNMTALVGDYHSGMLGGCILALQEEFLYPVLNTKAIFIDDFPSMQYNSESTVIKEEYNRTVREFYRDIWWPDMQSAAKKYDIKYTGLFMATYDDIVEPEKFSYIKDEMEQYYGNSLMKNGFELGAHGYNHQSLTLAGGTPKEMGYNPWNSVEDMCASLLKFREITESLFGAAALQTYVPPSNYLSAEGRQAVVESLPDLKCISGVYTNEGETGAVYVQQFEIAEDGIAEFPRVTSGMLDKDYDDFIMYNAAGAYGVFSHFIHPDDILDADRGAGLTWQELFDNFCEKVENINRHYEGMRALTASEAADALKIAYYAKPSYEVTETEIRGCVYDYYGECYFYLKSERQPEAASFGCEITRLNQLYDGDIYLVHLTAPEFVITLK